MFLRRRASRSARRRWGSIDIKADSALNQIILLFGASYILFDGGASLRLNVLKQVWITIVVIATVGVLITAVITGLAAHYILGVPMIVALLLGATLASTDPATLVPIFRQVHIRDRVAQTVMSESAFNDAMGAIVTFGVLAVATGSGEFSLAASLIDLLKQSVIGIVAGIALGYLAALLIAHEKFGVPRRIRAGRDADRRDRRLFRRRRPAAPAASWRCSCSASCSATRKVSASDGRKAKRRSSRNSCADHRVHHAPVHLHPARRTGRFRADEPILARRRRRRHGADAGGAAGDRVPVRAARPPRALEFRRDAVHVLDARDRRHSRPRWPACCSA